MQTSSKNTPFTTAFPLQIEQVSSSIRSRSKPGTGLFCMV
ncbi:hypothetical protein PG5_41550 [Pseudomonas sp. G5(2012)]|nr:hypothetical protein PG5_41550 [Pseudomonas sp. G5(2012)]